MHLGTVTKFSRYAESSDSDDAESSDSESSSTSDEDDATNRPATSEAVSQCPHDTAVNDEEMSSANGHHTEAAVIASGGSPTQRIADAETSSLSTSQIDASTDVQRSRRSSASSSSSDGASPEPIRAPLQLESASRSLLRSDECRNSVSYRRHANPMSGRRSPHQWSPSRSRHSVHSDVKDQSSQLRTAGAPRANLVKSSYSDSSQYLVKSPLQSRAHERLRTVSRSHSSEMRPRSPRDDDAVDGRKLSQRSRSRSPAVRKSPDQTASPEFSALRRQRSRSTDKELSHRRSSSGSGRDSRSRSGGRAAGSTKMMSCSRSQSPVGRSSLAERRLNLPAPRHDKRFDAGTDAKVVVGSKSSAHAYKDAAQRQPSRSSSNDRELSSRYHRDGSPQPAARKHDELSLRSSPHRSSEGRSSNVADRQPQRADTVSLSVKDSLESLRSKSRSLSADRSASPRLSARSSPTMPGQREKARLTDTVGDREGSRLAAKPKEPMLPGVRERLSLLAFRARKHRESSRGKFASRGRSPDNQPTSRVSERHVVRDRTMRSARRTDQAVDSYVRKRPSQPPPQYVASSKRKTYPDYSSRSPERRRPDKRKRNLPLDSEAKLPAKTEVCQSGGAEMDENRSTENLTGSSAGTSENLSGESSMAKRLMQLSESDKFAVEGHETTIDPRDKSPSSPPTSGLPEALTSQGQSEPDRSKPDVISTRKAPTLKRSAAPDLTVLEARKRRFDQTKQVEDSRDVCIRPSSTAETKSSSERQRPLSTLGVGKSTSLKKDFKKSASADVIDIHGVASNSWESDVPRTLGKTRMDVSDISDLTSADSSMSLEDISEDEAPQVQEQQLGESSDQRLNQRKRDRGVKKRDVADTKELQAAGKHVTDAKMTSVSSVVKPVKKYAASFEPGRSVEAVTRRSQPAVETHSPVDDSSTSDDAMVEAAVRNVVNKG